MNKHFIIFLIFFLAINTLIPAQNYFSPLFKFQRLYVDELNLSFSLAYEMIISGSETVYNDSIRFERGIDYVMDHEKKEITFFAPLGNVVLEYRIYPEDLIRNYYIYRMVEFEDSVRVVRQKKRLDALYADMNLNVTGSKTVAISIASDEDFSLDQTLFLRINGELAHNLFIEAQLSDSQSPITPEGDSREISNLDQVFLRLYGRNYEIAFGDLEMEMEPSYFLSYNPKFEGLKAGWYPDNTYNCALAISKGKNTILEFRGEEAKQGPYYLSSGDLSAVQVVPGSESVYLNGLLMERGVDYTIDYSEGSITFTGQHFISASSVIMVKFQYTTEDFRQNMYMVSTDIRLWADMHLQGRMLYQIDDKRNPLQGEYSPADIEILENAGDSTAWGSGIYPTEMGMGLYIFIEEENYYQYVGPDSTGNYIISFSYLGPGLGDYEQAEDDAGNIYYIYVGAGLGSYLPLRELARPELKANYDLIFSWKLHALELRSEAILSDFDANTYSGLDDQDNTGYAYHLEMRIRPDWDVIKPGCIFHYREIGPDLRTFSGLLTPQEAYEQTNIAEYDPQKEYSASLELGYRSIFSSFLNWKITDYGKDSRLHYLNLRSGMNQMKILPAVAYRYLRWRRDDNQNTGEESETSLVQHEINSSYKRKPWQITAAWKRKDDRHEMGQEKRGERQDVKKLDFGTYALSALNIAITLEQEELDTLLVNLWKEKQESRTYSLQSNFNLGDHSGTVRFSHRQLTGADNRRFDIGKITLNNSFCKSAVNLSSDYDVQNIEFYPKLREFQFVGENQGLYDADTVYVGYNNGDYNWVVTDIDYDNPELSLQVEANAVLYLNPAVITRKYFSRFRSESRVLIIENSRSSNKKDVYLLNPHYLLQEETTLYGRQVFAETLWWEIWQKKLTARMGMEKEKTLDSRYNELIVLSSIYGNEFNLRYSGLTDINIEFNYENRKEEESRYDSSIRTDDFLLELRYKPASDLNLKTGMNYIRERGEKRIGEDNYIINSYGIAADVNYFFQRKYRVFARISGRYNDRRGSTFLSFLADKKKGTIIKWNLNIDYRVNSFTALSVDYTGNKYPERREEHQLRLEVKAEF
ncbi:MAG: hypothetical protein JXB60_04010 [Candidatus Cloacimonetes bacterium]|nr:hypothetical protein [Candidatus Cloacimonadota bacterium]